MRNDSTDQVFEAPPLSWASFSPEFLLTVMMLVSSVT